MCKLDSDMIIKKDLAKKFYQKNDFFGFVQTVDGDRGWGKENFQTNQSLEIMIIKEIMFHGVWVDTVTLFHLVL